jgi:uncharacterized delta-60 repeat protein
MKSPCLAALYCLALVVSGNASPGNLDGTFTPAPGPNGTVRSVAVAPDGKIIVGGDFTLLAGTGRQRIARLLADGTLDSSFNTASGPNSYVSALDVQSDGNVVIAGAFTTVGTTGRKGYARLKGTDGSLDTSYAATQPFLSSGQAVSLKVQADGKALMAGPQIFFTVSFNRAGVVRLNADGSGDTTFTAPALSGTIMFAQPQMDGQIVVSGSFALASPARTNIVRLTATGALDATFSSTEASSGFVRAILPTSDGKYVIMGNFNGGGDPNKTSTCLRLSSDGSLDTSFAAAYCDASILAHAVQPDGAVIIAGDFGHVNGVLRAKVARLTASGALDTTFNVGTGGGTSVNSLALQNDGRILVAGAFPTFNDSVIGPVVRLLGDVRLFGPVYTPGAFKFDLFTLPGKSYSFQYKTNLIQANWDSLPSITGDGTVQHFSDTNLSPTIRMYRIVEN